MRKVEKFLLLILLLIPFSVAAKEETIKGVTYGNGNNVDYFSSVIEMPDGYIVAGYGWSNDIPGMPTYSSGDGRIVKYNKENFEVIWHTAYGGDNADCFYSMTKEDNDSFIVVGTTASEETNLPIYGGHDALIIKYDKDGNIIWQKNYGGSDYDEFYDVKVVNDGYIAVGFINSEDIDNIENNGEKDAIIVKYDKNGNLVWHKNYGGSSNDYFSKVAVANDGYITVGDSESNDIAGIEKQGYTDGIIVKYDFNGNLVWQKSYGGASYNDHFYDIAAVNDGYIAVGQAFSGDIEGLETQGYYSDGMIVKFNNDGNIIWQKSYGGDDNDAFYRMQKVNSNELVVVAASESNDITGLEHKGNIDSIILKYDIAGNLIEQQNYGGQSYDFIEDIIFTDKGYVVVGCTESEDIPNVYFPGGYTAGLIMEIAISYDLQKETDTIKNGTYDIKQVGQRAEISLNPDNGYELDKIIVKDLSGNELTYYEENGKYYVDLSDDIVVDVKYKQKSIINPNTGGLLMILEVSALIAIFACIFKGINKKKQTN